MATTGGDNAKLSSLFNKKKKGGIKSMNANVIAKESSAPAPPPTIPVATPAANANATATATGTASASIGASSIKPKAQNSPPRKPQAAPTKGVAELSIGDKKEAEEKREFQWAKQPKKYKNATEHEGVARTWEEQEERNKVAKRINLQSERAFPTLGADATQVQLNTMKAAPQPKAVATKNVWATLHDDDD